MDAKQSQFAVKLLPSMTDFAFLMPIAFLFGRMGGMDALLADCDTGWHIRTGEWILAHGAVPKQDLFSFSKPDGAWYAWEWLSDVIWAFLYSHGGLATVSFFAILLLAFTFVMLFRLVRRKSNSVTAIAITMLATAASAVHWLARPHLATLFFVVFFYGILERVRDGRTRVLGIPVLAILPVITVLWTNLHGGFFVGIVMLAAYGIAELLQIAFSPDGDARRPALRRAAAYFASALGCLAASLVNPYSYHLHVHMLEYLSDPYLALHIAEFLSVSFHHPLAIFFEGMLVLGALAACWHASKRSFTEPLMLLIWAHGALLSTRNIPIFMLVAAPPVASMLQAWMERLPRTDVAGWVQRAAAGFDAVSLRINETDAIGRWHPLSAFGVLLVAALLYAPHPPEIFRPEFSPKKFPAGAIDVLKRDPAARIFTTDQWGDYLIYRLYPNTRVFVDGRSDFYGTDFAKKYVEVLQINYGWDKTLAGFGVDTVLMPPGAPLAGALKESAHWRVVFDDGVSVVFRSARKTVGGSTSVAVGAGSGRDREITKTEVSDRTITYQNKSKT